MRVADVQETKARNKLAARGLGRLQRGGGGGKSLKENFSSERMSQKKI